MTTLTASSVSGVFDVSEQASTTGHEQVLFCRDEASGLRAIICIHNTTLGPALGGTRFYDYANEAAALRDVLRLSEGMTYKAAAAGLPLGGGKAVIFGDPQLLKTRELLMAYGDFVEQLGGQYVTAADVGTTAEDLDVVGTRTTHVVGRTQRAGGSGDSGNSTAIGVFEAMRSAAEMLWGADGLRGRRVGVEGVGKVGRHLVDLLVADGAEVTVADPSDASLHSVLASYGPRVRSARSVRDADLDVYAPCAMGATLTHASVKKLNARVVCGAANNQLASPDVDAALVAHGVVWVPDYVANAGGLVQVGGERLGRSPGDVRRDVRRIGATAREVLTRASAAGIGTGEAAAESVRDRLHAARARS